MKYYVKIKDNEVLKMSDRIPEGEDGEWTEAIYFPPSLADGQHLDFLYADTDKNPVEIKWKVKDREDAV
jgi:hypothetical protein